MLDDELNNEAPANESRPLSPNEKKILYSACVILLMGASFMAGRFSAGEKSTPPPSPPPLPVTQQAMRTPVPVPESALNLINFKGVSDAKKAAVLAEFNGKICGCGCMMTVAECIIKDTNCPQWKDHVTQLQAALGNGKKPDLSRAGKQPMGMPISINPFMNAPH